MGPAPLHGAIEVVASKIELLEDWQGCSCAPGIGYLHAATGSAANLVMMLCCCVHSALSMRKGPQVLRQVCTW